jgi:hypothetical protein
MSEVSILHLSKIFLLDFKTAWIPKYGIFISSPKSFRHITTERVLFNIEHMYVPVPIQRSGGVMQCVLRYRIFPFYDFLNGF